MFPIRNSQCCNKSVSETRRNENFHIPVIIDIGVYTIKLQLNWRTADLLVSRSLNNTKSNKTTASKEREASTIDFYPHGYTRIVVTFSGYQISMIADLSQRSKYQTRKTVDRTDRRKIPLNRRERLVRGDSRSSTKGRIG